MSPHSFFFPQLSMLTMMPSGLEYAFGWVQLVHLCPLTNSRAHPIPLLTGQGETEKVLTLCKCCSAIAQTSLCYQHCFSTNPNCSPALATLKNINSISAKTSTINIRGNSSSTCLKEVNALLCTLPSRKKFMFRLTVLLN